MSNTVKSKFAGLFRGLLGRKDREETSAEMEPRPVTGAAPDYPAPSTPSVAHPSAQAEAEPVGENEIPLPLGSVIAALSLELRAKVVVVPQPGASIRVPVDAVISQLAFGAVKISFGQLRQLAAGVFSNASSSELDSRQVSLPLHEILPRINPSLLARRTVGRVEVDEEIKGPFAGRGHGVRFTSEPLKAPAPKSAPQPGRGANLPPRAVAPTPSRSNPPAITPSTPIPFRPVTPAPTGASSGTPSVKRVPISPITSIAGNGSHGTNGANGSKGSNGSNGLNGTNGHRSQHPPIAPQAPKIAAAPAPKPAAPAPAAPRVEAALPTIFAGLWDLAEDWPDELKDEISRSSIANANLPLPGNLVDAGLKRGRITMTWKQIRLLAKPSTTPSPNDGLELELPLKVVAPLFFAAQKTLPAAKKAVSVSSEIPNLFFGFPQAGPQAPAPAPQRLAPGKRPPSSPPALAPLASAPVFQPDKNASNSNYYVWGDDNEVPREESEFNPPPVPKTDFSSRRAMPKEVVERAMTFRGVAGALVTLPDGLRVASDVPVEYNADTLAAFIPQIFERMNQSARELRMGALNNVSFTVGNVPWRIFRVNAVYLAAFGRAGESLPAADLAGLAGELDRKNK